MNFGDKQQAVIAGALGGVVRWLTLRENWREGFVSIVVGAICAVYVSPLAYPMLNPLLSNIIVDENARNSLANFVVGIGGIGVVGFILDLWKGRRPSKGDDE